MGCEWKSWLGLEAVDNGLEERLAKYLGVTVAATEPPRRTDIFLFIRNGFVFLVDPSPSSLFPRRIFPLTYTYTIRSELLQMATRDCS